MTPQNLMTQLTNILTSTSLYTRCRDLETFLNLCPLDELRSFFPGIVDNIFGAGGYPGWGLRNMSKASNPRDSEIVLKFLGSTGPLITTAYRLMDNQNLRYSFSFSSLPIKLAKEILNGNIPPFFASKIPIIMNNMSQRTISENLKLNPFEYIFFHFAYLNNARNADTSNYLIGWGAGVDSLYTNLLEDYLDYFFPCNGDGVPRINHQSIHRGPDPSYISPNSTNSLTPSNLIIPSTNDEMNRPTLFKPNMFQEHLSGGRPREIAFHSSHIFSQKEIWRTEAIFDILMEMWMNIDEDSNESLYTMQTDTFLPSVDLIKSIRMLVRHSHYFVNCVSRTANHPMDEIKRNCYPVFQKKLYVFIRHLFNKWPVDNSFRIVYETWLSYIQPWRYVNYERSRTTKERDEIKLTDQYRPFITDNLLFYTKFLQMILSRFLRGDINACKNALMLYRTMKVYCVSNNLRTMIASIERDVIRSDFNSTSRSPNDIFYNSRASTMNSTLGLSPESYSSSLKLAQLKQLMRDLESADFVYKPLFSEETKVLISQILIVNAKAKENLIELVAEDEKHIKPKNTWTTWLASFLNGDDMGNFEGNSIAEKRKTINYLDSVRTNLCVFFEVVDETEESYRQQHLLDSSNILNRSWHHNTVDFVRSLQTDFTTNDTFSNTSNMSMNRSRSFTGPGEISESMLCPFGNPDDELIRSDEFPFLVRFFKKVSDLINLTYGAQIQRIYYQETLGGKICKLIFAKPVDYHVLEKPEAGRQIKKQLHLPPRANLRFMGSRKFINFLLILLLGIVLSLYSF